MPPHFFFTIDITFTVNGRSSPWLVREENCTLKPNYSSSESSTTTVDYFLSIRHILFGFFLSSDKKWALKIYENTEGFTNQKKGTYFLHHPITWICFQVNIVQVIFMEMDKDNWAQIIITDWVIYSYKMKSSGHQTSTGQKKDSMSNKKIKQNGPER